MSKVVVFVLDVTQGKPAQGIPVALHQRSVDNSWRLISQGITDEYGEIATLVPPLTLLPKGQYRLIYQTVEYFSNQSCTTLYPEIVIQFEFCGTKKMVLPLLLSAYGYSTYRGS